MKLFWTGTDSLMLVDYSMRKLRKRPYWFVFRVLIKIMDYFIESHYCDSENVADNVRKFGTRRPVKILHDKINYLHRFEKQPHEGFNVIYYNPVNRADRGFKRWLYGIDIIKQVRRRMPEINFIELDGDVDMSKIYPITDFMIRPNRHDGASRMRQECDVNEIPYYWTNGKTEPNANEIIKKINEHRG